MAAAFIVSYKGVLRSSCGCFSMLQNGWTKFAVLELPTVSPRASEPLTSTRSAMCGGFLCLERCAATHSICALWAGVLDSHAFSK